jgi:drug/metabolite transporter (DMT)-like permease
MLNDNSKSYLHLHLIVFIWGFTAILGRLISLEALPLVWFRMFFAVFFIFLYIKTKKIPIKISKKEYVKFLFAGLIIALHWLTFFRAIKVSNVSITLACLSTGAFFTSLIEPLFFGKKLVWLEVFFGIIVVLGLSIIFNVEGEYVEGICLALISAFLSASFAVINSKFVKTFEPTLISFYELSGGLIFFTIFLLFSKSINFDFFQITTNDFIYLMILSSVCTAYAFIASTSVMKFLSPYTVMLTINMEPIYGVVLAVIIFKDQEQMSTGFYIGALIILITVITNGILKSRTKAT